MSTQEYGELREMIEAVDRRTELILESLKTCQGRCHVENPPGRWKGLGMALLALFRF
jgi:hypothetical protein